MVDAFGRRTQFGVVTGITDCSFVIPFNDLWQRAGGGVLSLPSTSQYTYTNSSFLKSVRSLRADPISKGDAVATQDKLRLTIRPDRSIVFVRAEGLEPLVHGGIVDMLWLARGDALTLTLLVEEIHGYDLEADNNHHDTHGDHHGAQTGKIPRGLIGGHQKWTCRMVSSVDVERVTA